MWSLAVFGVISIFGAATAVPLKKHHDSRIVGGDHVSIQDFPYQVALLTSNKACKCGGSIINKYYVLTAGHCANPVGYGFVRAGSNSSNDGGSLHRIIEIKRHEDYMKHPRGITNDIAVLKVEQPFIFNSAVQPIELYESEDKDVSEGDTTSVSGYGSWGYEAYELWGNIFNNAGDEKLMAVSVPIVSRAHCNQVYQRINFDEILKDRICAGYTKGGKDSCQGDSGGPLVIDGKQAGIVSYGSGCARPDLPGVYANVPYFVKWIKANTRFVEKSQQNQKKCKRSH